MNTMMNATTSEPIELRLAHSPDPDDAFMWWPLFSLDGAPPALETGRYRFTPITDDIQSLNERALTGDLEITAISCAQYPQVKSTYALTACGSSMGDEYGPKLVAPKMCTIDELRTSRPRIAIPGRHTSAFATASLLLGPDSFEGVSVPFDEIIDRVADGGFDAGIVIHEGQLTFADAGLHLVVDLGAWWTAETGLPLPLGANVIRRDLDARYGDGTLIEVTTVLRESIDHALANRAASVRYAMQFARGMTEELADTFVELYVNRLTLDYGERGLEAVRTFLARTAAAGLTDEPGAIEPIMPALRA
ncbi:MAG: ABC transporter substrate-binding protein [Phycisphaerales bacterium]|nr:ABC transporter substrate-binding protein [Phycisphaerales bacterium]